MKIQNVCPVCNYVSLVEVGIFDFYVEEEVSFGEVLGYNIEVSLHCPVCNKVNNEKVAYPNNKEYDE